MQLCFHYCAALIVEPAILTDVWNFQAHAVPVPAVASGFRTLVAWMTLSVDKSVGKLGGRSLIAGKTAM